MKNFKKYWHVWWTSAKLSLSTNLATRGASLMFILGKFLRFGFFIYFLFVLGDNIQEIAGYEISTIFTFFLVFNVFDLFGQLFFRGIYWFRQQVISGEFDFCLVKPINPLFQALTRQTDFLDMPLLIVVVIALIKQGISLNIQQAIMLILVSLSSIILITAVHTAVAALGVLTTEVDHTILIFRDLSLMARFPIDIYVDSIRAILTFVIPIGLIFTFPAKAFLGLLTLQNGLLAIFASGLFFYLSHTFWQYALTQYSSASS